MEKLSEMASKADITDNHGHIDPAKVKAKLDISNFDANAFLRGLQVAIVGANRAMKNPDIFSNEHYRQAGIAVAVGVVIHLLVLVPIYGVKFLLWLASWFVELDAVSWDEAVTHGLDFIQKSVLQVPFLVMTLMRFITPTLDNLFMESLRWVDTTYVRMHKHDNPATLRSLYYPPLRARPPRDSRTQSTRTADSFTASLARHMRRAGLSLAVYAASYLPVVGRFVLPAASFWTFRTAVGTGPAAVIFGTGMMLPRTWLVVFLQTYYSSRRLVRELLEPYFARVAFSPEQKRRWFRAREGLLFGFGVGFWMAVSAPFFGVLMYGIAEASTAYLVTKITDAPPQPGTQEAREFAERQQEWRNKQKFLSLPWGKIDELVEEGREMMGRETKQQQSGGKRAAE
ncbi:hypothetical protein TD95_002725 [Thielaviopsis punctulata]|uniref:Transmembrane protein UsgS n=1 Tax=Thielaviopsis punctulata TaxID=72032 RepID=A0A0F4Z622_9PEZI|nr:hypothetical protein TD95_002725 [Thielaviopsis punctulata]